MRYYAVRWMAEYRMITILVLNILFICHPPPSFRYVKVFLKDTTEWGKATDCFQLNLH